MVCFPERTEAWANEQAIAAHTPAFFTQLWNKHTWLIGYAGGPGHSGRAQSGKPGGEVGNDHSTGLCLCAVVVWQAGTACHFVSIARWHQLRYLSQAAVKLTILLLVFTWLNECAVTRARVRVCLSVCVCVCDVCVRVHVSMFVWRSASICALACVTGLWVSVCQCVR